MVKAIVILFAYFSCWTLPLIAQSSIEATSILKQDQSSLIKQAVEPLPLSIGDKMPDIAFNMLNYKKPVARMSDFKGKLVLLDFWATWCGSCIGAFPKLDSLQDKFGSKLQVILVNSEGTGDDQAKVATFIKKRETVDKEKFPFAAAAEDKLAVKLFPHEEVPHYVWVTPSGIVKAITSSKEVTAQNIQKVLNEESIVLPVKRDFFPDKISGFGEDILIDDNLSHFSFLKKGRLDGWRRVNQERRIRISEEKPAVTRGILMRNVSLMEMYETVIGLNKEYQILNHDRKRMIFKIQDSSDLFFNKTDAEKDTWEQEHLYSYDLVVPAGQSENLYDYILQDLNRYSGYQAAIKKAKVKCWLLVNTGTGSSVNIGNNLPFTSSSDNKKNSLKNMPVPFLVKWINLTTPIEWPVIDRTNNSPVRVTTDLDMTDPNIDQLRKKLNPYGLDLVESEEELDMFIIAQNHKPKP
jgi:thiol-disulfide isomerase/thioredoxin